MNKKENRTTVRRVAEKAVIRDEQDRRIQFAATNPINEVLKNLHTTLRGLDEDAISVSRAKFGSNKVTHEKKKSLAKRLAGAFINPFTAILFCLAMVSAMTDMVFPHFSLLGSVPEDFDPLTVVIILTMVLISGTLRFVQESRSGNAAEKLLAMITTTCTVTRREQEKAEIPMDDLVVGDIVHLSAGDMIPADVRILDAKDLFVSQASLTGESEPIEKTPNVSAERESVTDYTNIAFMGSNVVSGSATAVVVCTGDRTLFGSMASAIAGEAVETSFTKGVNAVSWVLIRFMLVMVPLVFFINGITKGDWLDAFLFGISIAVGLTPEMLPMIVTTCLAKGAVSMSKKQTIVKNLNSIQNFGAIDILCTDKTGTLTQDKVVLEYHLNVNGEDDTRVLRHAYLNSYFQTGYKNLMDIAIIRKTEEEEAADPRLLDLSENYVKVDEIPFDFTRRRLTTVVQDKTGKTQMVTKGLDFENVTLVGVLDADQSLYAQDYRARERTFSLITQVVGRAGRRFDTGRAVIQTYSPLHPVILTAARQDYEAFYESEMQTREALRCPPVCDITMITAVGELEQQVLSSLLALKTRLQSLMEGQFADVKAPVLGPAAAQMVKVMGRYRYHLTIRARDCARWRRLISGVLREFMQDGKNRGVTVFADSNNEM